MQGSTSTVKHNGKHGGSVPLSCVLATLSTIYPYTCLASARCSTLRAQMAVDPIHRDVATEPLMLAGDVPGFRP
ncbi:hypothetical protein HPB52_007167 [Rhipicephalus sanguineus]|uniref:Uncharacterized protein n=1 Tax=Rhipicephalus sanguineus TaxID=34632 RepID=A0A9D4T1C6_RHISA|nr:hypothetical protein HPB52_007167 [Rhipicephalus sanguineus]